MPTPEKLLKQLKANDPDVNIQAVQNAYEYAKKMHEGQTRSSGEPY